MLVGVPLGLSSKRGGKGTGFVVTLLLVFVYYFLSSVGVCSGPAEQGARRARRVGRQHRLHASPACLLIQQMACAEASL
jgi:hypothetical protein